MVTIQELEELVLEGNGWGYAVSRGQLSPRVVVELDAAVVRQANAMMITLDALTEWAASKLGRWLSDAATGLTVVTGSPVRSEVDALVAEYLNHERLAALIDEGLALGDWAEGKQR